MNRISSPAGVPARPVLPAIDVRLLLAAVIGRIRRYGGMPLRFHVDAAGMAREAWEEFCACTPGPHDWMALAPLMDETVAACLPCVPGQSPWRGAAEAANFAGWVEQFQAAVRKADPQCAEAAALLAEGWPARETARRLGIGPRLLSRITAAFHSAAGESIS